MLRYPDSAAYPRNLPRHAGRRDLSGRIADTLLRATDAIDTEIQGLIADRESVLPAGVAGTDSHGRMDQPNAMLKSKNERFVDAPRWAHPALRLLRALHNRWSVIR